MDEKQLKAMYEAMSGVLELGTFDEFKNSMYSDEKRRKAFYDEASGDLELGDFDTFNNSLKKKELPGVTFPIPYSTYSNGSSRVASVSTELAPPSESVKKAMRLNPFFSTPTLDRPDVNAVRREQQMGAEIQTAEEKRTYKTFFERPTPTKFDAESGRDVLDEVFKSKRQELSLQGKLDVTAQQRLAKEREEFSERFYNGQLTGDDVETIKNANPIAYPEQYAAMPADSIATGINNKTKNLAAYARAVNEAGATQYALTKEALASSKKTSQDKIDELVGTNYIYKQGDRFVTDIPERQYMADQANQLQREVDEADLKSSYINTDFKKNVYDPHIQKIIAEELLPQIMKEYGGMSMEDIYKWEGGMRMTGDNKTDSQLEAMKALHNDPNFKLGDIIKYDETNHLTPDSYQRLRERITEMVNNRRDAIIEAYEHGEVGRASNAGAVGLATEQAGVIPGTEQGATQTPLPINPEDLISKVANYFNYELPAKVLAESYTNQFKESEQGKKIAPFIDNQKKLQAVNQSVSEYDAALKASLDAGYLTLNNKYDKLLSANPEYTEIAASWQDRVDKGLITPERAQMEMFKQAENNPVIKKILDSKREEVDKLRNKANKQREQFIIKGVSSLDNNLTLDDNGQITVKGMTRDELDKIITDYETGYEQKILSTYQGQEQLLANRADFINEGMRDTFGSLGGAFIVGVSGAVDDLGAATSRWLYHKTGDAGDALNYFESEKQRPLNIGEYADKHYQYKGLSSLLDPAYYGFASGQSFPYAAPAIAIGAATGGTATGIILGSGIGATLETAENALLTRNELFLNGTNADGMKLTSVEADRIAAQQFKDELLPNITFQALELGALLRSAKYANPSLSLKTVGKGVVDVVASGGAEAIQEGIQGFIQYNAKQRGQGLEEADLFDYMQSDDFVQNFFGGFAGGVSMGAPVKPMQYASSLINWKQMVSESRAAFGSAASNDFANDVPYANALHAELNGTPAEFRDGIRLRIENAQYADLREKENLNRILSYSENLSKTIDREGIVPNNINELYAAHVTAMADTYDAVADKDKGVSNQSKVYQQQAKRFRDESIAALSGDAKVYYAIDKQDRPIFMSEKTANVLSNAGVFEAWKKNGNVKQVNAINDDVFNDKVSTLVTIQPQATTVTSPVVAATEQQQSIFDRAMQSSAGGIKTTLDAAVNAKDIVGGYTFLQDQALDRPNSLKEQLGNNEELTTDIIAAASPEQINRSIQKFNDMIPGIQDDSVLEEVDRHITLLEKGLAKQTTNDSQNIQGVSGQVGERQEPVQVQPDQGASTQATSGSGVFQEAQEEDVADTRTPEEQQAAEVDYNDREKQVRDYIAANNIDLTEEEIDDVAALYEPGENIMEAIEAVKEVPEELKADGRSAGDLVRDLLRINLSKLSEGGLQSNILGIAVGTWNTAVETIALAIDAGVAIAEAVRRGYESIRETHPDKDESAIINVLNSLTRGLEEKPVRKENEKYSDYAVRVLGWRRKMLSSTSPSKQTEALAGSQQELSFVKKINEGIELLKSDMSLSNQEFNQRLGIRAADTNTYIAALKYLKGSNKEAAAKLTELRRENPKQVVMSEMALLKKQYKDFERGYVAGSKESQEQAAAIRQEISTILDDLNEEGFFKGVKYTPSEILRMASYVNNAINDNSLNAFKEMVVNLMEKADYGRKVAKVKDLVRQVKKALKKKTPDGRSIITANMVPVIKDMTKLKALRVSNIDRYIEMLTDIVESSDTKERPIPAFGRQAMVDFIANEKVYDIQQTAVELMDKYYEVMTDEDFVALSSAGKASNFPSEQNMQNVVNGIVSNIARSYTESLDELKAVRDQLNKFYSSVKKTVKLIEESKGTVTADVISPIDYNASSNEQDNTREDNRLVLEEMAIAQQLSINLDDPALTPEKRQVLSDLKGLNVQGRDANTLRLFMNVLNNVTMNDDFSGAGDFQVKKKAQDNIKKLFDFLTNTGRSIKKKSKANTVIKERLRTTRESLSSTEQELLEIASNDPHVVVAVTESVEFDKIKAGWSKTVSQLKQKLTQKLQDIADRGDINHKDPKSQMRLTMFAWLNQYKTSDTELERRAEFAKRLNEVKEDIAIKEASKEEDNVREANLLKEVYNELVQKIIDTKQIDINKDDISDRDSALLNGINFLTPGEQQAYEAIREFNDEFRPQFIDIMERLLNKEFIGYDNYMVDKTRRLLGGLADIDINDSTFFGAASREEVADESGSFAGRIEGNRIRKPISGQDTRVIDYDFFNSQISTARNTLYDINTLEDRMIANEVVSSTEMRDGVGHVKADMLKKNLSKEIQASVGLTKNNTAGLKIFSDTVNLMTRLAAKKNLYGFMAFPKQLMSAMANTMAFLGVDSPYIVKALWLSMENPDVQEILNSREVSLRGATKGGTSVGADDVVPDKKGLSDTDIGKTFLKLDKFLTGHKEFTGEERKLMGYFLEAGDVYGAKATWVAMYAKYLKNNGIIQSLSDIDWAREKDNLNRDAAIYADVTTSAQLNTNSKNAMGAALLNNDSASNILRGMYALFGMFGVNKSINSYLKLKAISEKGIFNGSTAMAMAKLFTGGISQDATQAQKDYAVKGLVAGFFEDLAFAGVKFVFGKLAIMAISQMIMGALGDDEGEKLIAENLAKTAGIKSEAAKDLTEDKIATGGDVAKGIVANAAGNYLFSFGGTVGQEKLQEATNWLYNKAGGEGKIFQELPKNPNMKRASGLTGSSGLEDFWGDLYRLGRISLSEIDREGNPIEQPEGKEKTIEQLYSTVSIIHDIMQVGGIGDADFERVLQRRMRNIDQAIGQRYGDDYWMNVAEMGTRELNIAGHNRELTDEQQKRYKEFKSERMKALKDSKIPKELKTNMAVDYAKAKLIKEFGVKNFKLKPKEKPE